jgi:hypothetical protein
MPPLLERVEGVEPSSLAWKARVIAVIRHPPGTSLTHNTQLFTAITNTTGGEGWIRTNVGVSQQIYSLPPLATRAPPREPHIIT